jgi:prepilin signal peptidase PulO-like enzyme (type II secretory pathway)
MNLIVSERAGVAPRTAACACALTAAVVVVGALGSRPAPEVIALVGWSLAIVVAAVIDAHSGRLPDAIVVPGMLCTIAAATFAGRGAGAITGAALLWLPMLATHLARPAGLGFGDVKFALLLGAGVGVLAPALVLPAFLLAAVVHAAVCLGAGARGRLVPFGPALALGSAVIVAAGTWGLR